MLLSGLIECVSSPEMSEQDQVKQEKGREVGLMKFAKGFCGVMWVVGVLFGEVFAARLK